LFSVVDFGPSCISYFGRFNANGCVRRALTDRIELHFGKLFIRNRGIVNR